MPIRVFDDSSSELVYSGSWLRTGTWSSSDGQRGTASSTNEEGATVSFTFPVAATGLRFYALKSSRGGYFGACVDCSPNAPFTAFVSGFNATDDGTNPPTYIYHYSWTTPSIHTVIISNQEDRRGIPAGNSVLTLDRFELDVPVTLPTTVSASQTPSNTAVLASVSTQVQQTTLNAGDGGGGGGSPPVTTQVVSQGGGLTTLVITQNVTAINGAGTPTVTGVSASNTAASSAGAPNTQSQTGSSAVPSDKSLGDAFNGTGSSSKSTPLGGIIGGLAGGLAIIALMILLFIWLKKPKRRTGAATGITPLEPPDMRTITSDLTNSGEVTSYDFRSNEKGNRYHSEALYSPRSGDDNPGSNPATSNTALLGPSPVSPSASALSYVSSHRPSESLSNDNLNAPTAETRRVRELDAGPVPGHFQYEDNAETLPPEYGQLFSNRLSGRTPSEPGQQAPRSPSPPLPSPLHQDSRFSTVGLSTSTGTAASRLTTTATLSSNYSPPPLQPLQPVRRM